MLDINPFPHGPGVIAPIALAQLERWQALAEKWPFCRDENYWRCGDCMAIIHQVWDSRGVRYQITDEELCALEVAHLRQRHEGELPDED